METISSIFWTLLWTFAIVFLVVAIVGLASYNKLQRLSQAVKEARSNVQVAISRKLSLVNQLMDVAKGYLEAEQMTHLKISQDSNAETMLASYQQSGAVLTSLQGFASRFPDLKANEQFKSLTEGIAATERDVQEARQRYNAEVRAYNAQCLSIPTVFVARPMGFSSAPFLEFDQSGVMDPKALQAFRTDDGERLHQLLAGAGKTAAGATRLIATQATTAGRLVASRIRESAAGSMDLAQPQYFFRTSPTGVPAGPLTLEEIRTRVATGGLPAGVEVAQAGAAEWSPLSSVNT